MCSPYLLHLCNLPNLTLLTSSQHPVLPQLPPDPPPHLVFTLSSASTLLPSHSDPTHPSGLYPAIPDAKGLFSWAPNPGVPSDNPLTNTHYTLTGAEYSSTALEGEVLTRTLSLWSLYCKQRRQKKQCSILSLLLIRCQAS